MLGYADVRAAAQRLAGVAHRTPVMRSRTLDAACGRRGVRQMRELAAHGRVQVSRRLQYARVACRRPSAPPASSHSRAAITRKASRWRRGCSASRRRSSCRRTRRRSSSPPRASTARRSCCTNASARTGKRSHAASPPSAGATIVPPFDDPRIVAGAGTAALELLEEAGRLDAIVVPVGGGGLMGGTALAAHGIDRSHRDLRRRAGGGRRFRAVAGARRARHDRRAANDRRRIANDRTRRRDVCDRAQARSCSVVTVSDDELRDAMRFAFERLKLVVEPSGAARPRGVTAAAYPRTCRAAGRSDRQRRQHRRSPLRATPVGIARAA